MDDATFELLKRIDEGFEGSGPYSKSDLLLHDKNRCAALAANGDEGFDLRMAVMKAVETEKQRRCESGKTNGVIARQISLSNYGVPGTRA